MTATPISAHLFSSVNGVCEAPDQFQFDSFGAAEGELMGRSLAGVTDVVMGRVLWEEWSKFWPAFDASDPFAQFINPARKHVVSTSLTGELDWNSTVLEGDPVTAVRTLQDSADGGVIVAGGVETVRRLFLAGVIDTLTLTTHPVITGDGRRVFDSSVPLTRLRLVDHLITPAGNAVLTYSRRD